MSNDATRAALAQALDALEIAVRQNDYDMLMTGEELRLCAAAITAAEAALAAPQEPVAWTVAGEGTDWSQDFSKYRTQHYVRPVYAAPAAPARAEPTDAEIETATEFVRRALIGTYICGRVWDAWSYSTMSEDDFTPADETCLPDEIARAVLALRDGGAA